MSMLNAAWVQRFMLRMLTRHEESCLHNEIEITGSQEDRQKVAEALEWIQAFSPELNDRVHRHTKSIVCRDGIRQVVMPRVWACILESSWLRSVDIKRIANRLDVASRYVAECEATGKYRTKGL